MAKRYTLADHLDKVNPEFVGISDRYSKIKKEKQDTQKLRHTVLVTLSHTQRTKDTLQQTLQKKQKELKWLKTVKDRHEKDIMNKIQNEEMNLHQIEQLKAKSQIARKQNKKNINEATNSVKQQKLKASLQVKNKLNEIKKLKQNQREQLEMFRTVRMKSIQLQKSERKSRIDKFFRRKNRVLLNNYKQLIKQDQYTRKKSLSDIDVMQQKTHKIDLLIRKKQKKLQQLQQNIKKLKLEASQSRSLHGYSVDFSRISKKSSRPFDILLKDSRTDI